MATTVEAVVPLSDGMTLYYFKFTHTEGAAEETVKVQGKVYGALMTTLDSGGMSESNPCKFSESVSGGTNTVTLLWQGDTSDGTLRLDVKS